MSDAIGAMLIVGRMSARANEREEKSRKMIGLWASGEDVTRAAFAFIGGKEGWAQDAGVPSLPEDV
jgi:hypothetical protein